MYYQKLGEKLSTVTPVDSAEAVMMHFVAMEFTVHEGLQDRTKAAIDPCLVHGELPVFVGEEADVLMSGLLKARDELPADSWRSRQLRYMFGEIGLNAVPELVAVA